ncbi:hypothetical protein EDB85DRAFT_2157155 [Lactarius pseudohatsudake]|nr:hypothetical protein EDB85DRAFT_2157155 [Lactarius pseudohatsudake]
MSTTPLVSTVPVRPPVAAILENLTIPSQDLGIPEGLILHTPYSNITDSPPLAILALATKRLVDNTLPALTLVSKPDAPFPTAQGYTLTPLSSPKPAPPDPRLALFDDEEPIDYDRVAPTEGDDVDPKDPGVPFFPNDPSSPTHFTLMIPTDTGRQLAPYIYYRKNYTECVGTMGKGQPCYICPIFLRSPNFNHEARPITDGQLLIFHPHDPRHIVIDEVLMELHNPRLHAEIARLRECLVEQDELKQRQTDLLRLEQEAIRDRFNLDTKLGGVRKRLQYARAIPLISEKYVELTARPKPVKPRFETYAMPFVPCEGGPCEMLCVHGEKDKHRRKTSPEGTLPVVRKLVPPHGRLPHSPPQPDVTRL